MNFCCELLARNGEEHFEGCFCYCLWGTCLSLPASEGMQCQDLRKSWLEALVKDPIEAFWRDLRTKIANQLILLPDSWVQIQGRLTSKLTRCLSDFEWQSSSVVKLNASSFMQAFLRVWSRSSMGCCFLGGWMRGGEQLELSLRQRNQGLCKSSDESS